MTEWIITIEFNGKYGQAFHNTFNILCEGKVLSKSALFEGARKNMERYVIDDDTKFSLIFAIEVTE